MFVASAVTVVQAAVAILSTYCFGSLGGLKPKQTRRRPDRHDLHQVGPLASVTVLDDDAYQRVLLRIGT